MGGNPSERWVGAAAPRVEDEALLRGRGVFASNDFMPTGPTYTNCAHTGEVEVDPGTGRVSIRRYVAALALFGAPAQTKATTSNQPEIE